MGTDAIFGPIKAACQAGCGKRDEAKETMKTFKETNPVVLGVRGCYHMAKPGGYKKGKELGKRGLKNTAAICEGVVNGMPLVGHAKGAYHYARGDTERGDKAMKSSSRSTAGLVGAVAGFAAGNVPGAVAGYMGGVTTADGVISGVDSTVHGQKRLNGNLATFEAAYKNPSVGNVFDATLGVALDLSAAVAVGSGLGDTLTSTGDVSDASTGANDTNDVSGMEADPDAADADTNNTVNGGGDAGNSGANADSTRTGEDLPFIGDEIKFVHDVIDLIAARRGGDDGGHGGGGRGFVKDVGDSFPDDMKIPEDNLDLGTNTAERIATLENIDIKDGVEWGLLPDSKRDWFQEIEKK